MEATETKIRIDFELRKEKSDELFKENKFRGHERLVDAVLPPNRKRRDIIRYHSYAHSIREMQRIIDKFNLSILLTLAENIIGFSDKLKAGKRDAIMTTDTSLTKNFPGWARATAEEALEIVLLLMLKADKERSDYLLEPYFNGTIMVCSTNNDDGEFIALEIDKANKIIMMSQYKEDELISKAIQEEKNVSSIWMREIEEEKY